MQRKLIMALAVLMALCALPKVSSAQQITTAVPFLLIAPDARASGMGDGGG